MKHENTSLIPPSTPMEPKKSSMKLVSISIKEATKRISKDQLFLPPIQRDFVWEYDRMIGIFDSLFRGYPISNFIFWKMEKATIRKFPLHKFRDSYSEKIYKRADPAPSHGLDRDVWSVIDGQQRLSSIFIGLCGRYNYKPGRRRILESNLISCKLHFNLMAAQNLKPETNPFEFLDSDEQKIITPDYIPFEVGRVLDWVNPHSEAESAYLEILEKVKATGKKTPAERFTTKKEIILAHLVRLYHMVHDDDKLYVLEIDNQDLDEVVDIFIRINSGGMTLKTSDLLFSTLVSSWPEGEEEIDGLVVALLQAGLNVSKDFVMRACIVLSDLPVKYNLDSFRIKNAGKIRNDWPGIKSAINDLVGILPHIGYSYQKGLSENALIPIVYYIYKGGNIKKVKPLEELKTYFVASQIFGIYGSNNDQVLEKLREHIKKQLLINKDFQYSDLHSVSLPGNKSYLVSEEILKKKIEDTFYPEVHAYFILSLIYPNVDLKVKKYELDHLHPKSSLTHQKLLEEVGIEDYNERAFIVDNKNHLANLQFMDSGENNSKRAASLIDFLKAKSPAQREKYLEENLLPKWSQKELFEVENYKSLINKRSGALLKRLVKIFRLK